MIQLTIIKITGYGPWTLTLGCDREHSLQMIQSSLYHQTQKLFSDKQCLVFANRFDEIFAVSNGLSINDHIEIKKKLGDQFKLEFSIAIGYGETPFDANLQAYKARKTKSVLNQENEIFGFANEVLEDRVSIIHMDLEESTSLSKTKSPYEISNFVFKIYSEISDFFLKYESLAFFMGGDNFMILSTNAAKENIQNFLEIIEKKYGVSLNCGIGTSINSREAAKLATKSLDTIREMRNSGIKQRILELTC